MARLQASGRRVPGCRWHLSEAAVVVCLGSSCLLLMNYPHAVPSPLPGWPPRMLSWCLVVICLCSFLLNCEISREVTVSHVGVPSISLSVNTWKTGFKCSPSHPFFFLFLLLLLLAFPLQISNIAISLTGSLAFTILSLFIVMMLPAPDLSG